MKNFKLPWMVDLLLPTIKINYLLHIFIGKWVIVLHHVEDKIDYQHYEGEEGEECEHHLQTVETTKTVGELCRHHQIETVEVLGTF